jgi:hypothetical protein
MAILRTRSVLAIVVAPFLMAVEGHPTFRLKLPRALEFQSISCNLLFYSTNKILVKNFIRTVCEKNNEIFLSQAKSLVYVYDEKNILF